MGFRIPGGIDYVSVLGSIGDNIVNAYDKYQAPKLLEQIMSGQQGQAAAPTMPVQPSAPLLVPNAPAPQATRPSGDASGVPANLLPIYKKAEAETGIPAAVLIAQHKQESRFNPNAIGSAGEIGIGQILPSTARDPGFGVAPVDPAALRDPETNIMFSARYLAARAKAAGVKDWNGPAKGLLAYNGGGDPNYVENVMRYMPGASQAAGAVPPPNQVADASGSVAPQNLPQPVAQTGPRYSPQLIQRLMANPYTKAYGQVLLQNMMKQEVPAFHQFGNTVYRQQGGQLVPVINVPDKPMAMSEGQTLVDPRTGQVISAIPKGPMTMSEGQTLVDPKTGAIINAIPKDRPPVTLSEGQVLVDPRTGQQIAAGGQKNDVAKNNAQREAEADRIGLQGEDRTQYILNGKLPSQAEKQTTDQANAALYATRMRESARILDDPTIAQAGLGVSGAWNNLAGRVPVAGNALVPKEYQQLDQARRDFVNATLRRESGAAISQSEFENANKQYFPQPGDSPEVIKQKARNRQIAIEGIANAASPAFKEQFFGTKKPVIGGGQQQREPLPKGYSAARAVSEAKQAIAQGRDPEGVKAKLKSFGIDPSVVDK